MKIEEAFEIMWEKYWNELIKRMPIAEGNDLLNMGIKKSLKAAYKSGFYTSRHLSIMDDDADKSGSK